MADSGPLPPAGSTATTCPYCGTGCGVLAGAAVNGRTAVAGDQAHPANFGKLCVKGAALGETLGLQGRLLHPLRREAGVEKRESWDAALAHIASNFQRIAAEHGPESIAFYISGQLLTEDYYVCNKFVKGFLGHAHIDTNSRLCMASAVAGHKRAFGEDIVPVGYADFDEAELIVLVGSNTAWCHPILFQRITAAREKNPALKIVVIDPRRTATTELADLHLPIKGGSDVWLFNGLLTYLHEHGVMDTAFVKAHTQGVVQALAIAQASAGSVESVARECRVDEHALAQFYALFAQCQRVITCFSMGVNQSGSGTDKVNSIINAHLLTGRIGKPGAGPFSLTGQPNAMGGREVGGLSNTLAAHLDLENPAHRELVQNYWRSPAIADTPGLKAVELFEAVEAGRIKALWIIATNPVVSLPDADQVKRALAKCELVIVSDVVQATDTSAYAHLLLPALAWGEKSGTVTNSERCISRQRAFLPAPGEAKADWWMVAEVAKRLGHGVAFDYAGPHEIFDEHARLSGHENRETGTAPGGFLRAFNISGLAGLNAQQYDALQPTCWPVLECPSRLSPPASRLFSDGRYYHPDGKARFIATAPRAPGHAPSDDYPLVLNTGRVRDHWHTLTRTGSATTLSAHTPEPFVDLHPQDALLWGVRAGGLARVSSRWGSCVLRVRCSGEMPRRSLFVPIHWSDQFASDARVGSLVNPVVDPLSGEPEFKHTPCRVEEFRVAWHGFVLTREAAGVRREAFKATAPPLAEHLSWWTRITGESFTRYEIAGRKPELDWPALARSALGITADSDWLEYQDQTTGSYRAAYVLNERIEACLFVSPRPDLPSRAWLSGLFTQDVLEEKDRIGLLIGEPLTQQADTGPTVCSCFGVGRNMIREAIHLHDLKTPKAVSACIKAGGNCGSCIPEIKKLIAECAYSEAES